MSASTQAAGSSCVAEAGSLVTQHLATANQNWYPSSPVNGALAKGKSYWIITLTTSIPSNAQFADAFKAAAEAVGAKVTIYDGRATPAIIGQGVDQAVAAHADGIVLSLVDPAIIAPALANAAAAHIPVFAGDNGLPSTPFPSGIVAATSENQQLMGAWEVDSALQLTKCSLHALVVDTPGNVGSINVTSGITAELKKLCPTACSQAPIDVQAQDIATKLTADVENSVRVHPDANAIIIIASPYYPYVVAGLQALHSQLPIIVTSSMGDLAGGAGAGQVASTVVYAPAGAHGYFYMDTILRYLSGQSNVLEPFPLGLVDRSSMSPSDPSSYKGTSPYANYQSKFAQLWGVGS